jgi:hypothetical protein
MKTTLSIAATFFLLASLAWGGPTTGTSGDQKVIFRGSLGTGSIQYGSPSVKEYLGSTPMDRFVFAFDGGADWVLSPYLHLIGGLTGTLDLNFKDGSSAHFFDYGAYTGLRFLPIPPRFAIEASYVLGQRRDSINTNRIISATSHLNNGFRIGAEVMLGYLTYRLIPIAGVSWRYMPRTGFDKDENNVYTPKFEGNDQILTLYLAIRYQKRGFAGGNLR